MFEHLIEVLQSLPGRVGKSFDETFRSLKERNFRVYNTGMFISSVGTWMQGVALSWLVYRLTGSAAALGLVTFASNLPLLLLTFVGGMTADRFDKRKILLITNSIAMLQAIVLTVLVFTGLASVTWIIVLAAILGCTTAFEVPTRQSLVPMLISDQSSISNAIGLSSATFHVSRMVGPALGGLLIAGVGEQMCFAINALSFVAALTGLWMVRLPAKEANNTTLNAGEKAAEKAIANAKFMAVLKRPGVYTLLFLAAFVSTFGLQYSVLMPVIADKLLHGQSVAYGFLSAAGGVGALAGALVVAFMGDRQGLRKRIGWACLGLSLALVLLALSQFVILSVVAILAAGSCLSLHWSGGNSLMQQCVEPSSRGKLMGVYTTFTLGLAPFTALFAGWTAEQFGVSTALLISASGMLIGSLLYLVKVRKLADACM
ncbi:MAG: MFS transporter [Candidatus Obscuribacterales bacterium]|jgi:MFS family permease